MAGHSPDEERQWAAEKRDFVADRRDELAAERDAVADARDRTANERESAMDQRERDLDARSAELGKPPISPQEAAQRSEVRAAREGGQKTRKEGAADRENA